MLIRTTKKLCDPPVVFKSLKEIFRGYAAVSPLAHALYRTAESKHLREVQLCRPVLDLGCGSGEFAQLALRGNVDVGIDISLQRLSGRRPGTRNACLGDACRLPFTEEQFQTVLAVSVLEHLHQPQRALAEVCRVLKPGGQLVGTAMLLDVQEQLFYPRMLRILGLSHLYVRCHEWLFDHRSLRTQPQWEEMIAVCGLELLVSRKVVVPRLTRYWDMLLPFAWPYRVLPRWMYPWVWRAPAARSLVQNKLLPLCHAEERDGSSLFFVACKREESP